MKYIITLLFFILIASCSTDKQKNNIVKAQESILKNQNLVIEEPVVTMTTEESYCYITDILNFNDTSYLKVDFIQFLTDQEAIKKVLLRNNDFDIEENGDTTYYVPNGYLIVNENPKISTFQLTDSTSYELLQFYGDTLIDFKDKNNAFKRVNHIPYVIVTENGKVKKLTEIFIP